MNDFYEVEDVLAHYGVKGMKWGVRKAENANLRRLASDAATKKDAHARVHSRETAKNKEAGMKTRDAYKKAANHKDVKKAEVAANKADAEFRSALKSQNNFARAERQKTISRFKKAYTTDAGKGHRWVSAALTGPIAAGYNYQRSAGYGRNATVITTMLTGPLGNIAAAEIAARSAITED